MSISNSVQSNSLMMTVVPEDVFIKLFGEYFDVETQGRVASVCKLFNELLKKNWIVPLGNNDRNRCILDLCKKTITINGDRLSFGHCWFAMNYHAVPNGSFAVYPMGENSSPCAVIKDQRGKVVHIIDVAPATIVHPEVVQLKDQIGKPSEYYHFALDSKETNYSWSYESALESLVGKKKQ